MSSKERKMKRGNLMDVNDNLIGENNEDNHVNESNKMRYYSSGGKKRKVVAGVIALLLVTNGVTAYLSSKISFKVSKDISNGIVINKKPDSKEVNEFSKLFLVKDKLEEYYDGNIDENTLVEGAIKGMTASLNDPYTVFMNQKEFQALNTETEGKYVGLGIQVGVVEDKIVIIAPFDNSPAKKAGLLSGDIIEKVNDVDVAGQDLEKAVSMMKGKKGEEVKLTVMREGKGEFEVSVVRDEIELITVSGEMIDDKVGYVQVSMFDENTADNFKKKLDELSKDGMKSLIIDLRGNPGGLVNECVQFASNFIPKGETVVSTIDKYERKKVYQSEGGDYENLPVVILTDGGTASASEIFSGAMRDYNKATLVGEKTFGKGIVQTVLYRAVDGFGDGTALKVTISSYYTPNGENIHKKGIEPNVKVEYPKELKEQEYTRSADPQFTKALQIAREKLAK